MMKMVLVLVFLVLGGCATLKDHLNDLRMGMDKSDVLDEAGNPAYTFREHDRDNWVYIYYQNDQKWERQISFSQEKLVRIGRPVPANSFKRRLENTQSMKEYEQMIKAHRRQQTQQHP